MRSAAWISASARRLAAGLLLLGACAGDYSLPPTRCDEWCDVTRGGRCEDDYKPADCVSSCEAAHMPQTACGAELAAVLACYRNHPDAVAEQCYFVPGASCTTESTALGACTAAQYGATGRR
ncbi:MAG TPA: hypothetical protein VEQ59_25535 [Polyangiaceae bacterium]|nr:hypothetical protein [Polyangiaceae bacterium]